MDTNNEAAAAAAAAAATSTNNDEEEPTKQRRPELVFPFGLKTEYARDVVERLKCRHELVVEISADADTITDDEQKHKAVTDLYERRKKEASDEVEKAEANKEEVERELTAVDEKLSSLLSEYQNKFECASCEHESAIDRLIEVQAEEDEHITNMRTQSADTVTVIDLPEEYYCRRDAAVAELEKAKSNKEEAEHELCTFDQFLAQREFLDNSLPRRFDLGEEHYTDSYWYFYYYKLCDANEFQELFKAEKEKCEPTSFLDTDAVRAVNVELNNAKSNVMEAERQLKVAYWKATFVEFEYELACADIELERASVRLEELEAEEEYFETQSLDTDEARKKYEEIEEEIHAKDWRMGMIEESMEDAYKKALPARRPGVTTMAMTTLLDTRRTHRRKHKAKNRKQKDKVSSSVEHSSGSGNSQGGRAEPFPTPLLPS